MQAIFRHDPSAGQRVADFGDHGPEGLIGTPAIIERITDAAPGLERHRRQKTPLADRWLGVPHALKDVNGIFDAAAQPPGTRFHLARGYGCGLRERPMRIHEQRARKRRAAPCEKGSPFHRSILTMPGSRVKSRPQRFHREQTHERETRVRKRACMDQW